MKIIAFLYTAAVFVGLSRASPYTDANQVHDEVQAYIYELVGSMRVPMMRGGSSSLLCYDVYMPQINEVLDNSRIESEELINNAEAKEEAVLESYKDQKSALVEEVDKLTASLGSCAAETKLLAYLACMQRNADANLAAMESINANSKELYEKLESSLTEIENEKNEGIEVAICKAKEDTDALFNALQDCLINGYHPTTSTTAAPVPPETDEPSTDEPNPEEQDDESI